MPKQCLVAVVGLALLCLAGCTSRSITVKGKLILPGKTKLGTNDTVNIVFMPEGEGKKASAGIFNAADSTFVAKDVTPGKNRIEVKLTPYMGDPSETKRETAYEALNSKFGGGTSPLQYDVTNDPEQNITVDLDKGTVTKGG